MEPGDLHYLVVDRVAEAANDTTQAFTVTVACEPVACGNGIVELEEACDDDNTDDGDGCSSTCEVEAGYECRGEPSLCNELYCRTDANGAQPLCRWVSCLLSADPDVDAPTCTGTPSLSGPLDDPIEIGGFIDDSLPMISRPIGLASCDFGSERLRHYQTVTFENTSDDPLTVAIEARWDFDGFLILYDETFDPTDESVGCLESNDDFTLPGAENIRLGSAIQRTLDPESTYIVVMTQFSTTHQGPYHLTIRPIAD